MTIEWEDSIKRGIALSETPYFFHFDFAKDPLDLKPVSAPEQLVDFEKEIQNLLTLIGKVGIGNIRVIPIVGLRGTGGSSILLTCKAILDSMKNSTLKEVSDFASGIVTNYISARSFAHGLDEDDDNGEDDFSQWIKSLELHKTTHLFVDDCDVLDRYSVFPYLEAIAERLGKWIVLILRLTPSSYNRLIRDMTLSAIASTWLTEQIIISPGSETLLRAILKQRLLDVERYIEEAALISLHSRTLGSIKEAIGVLRISLEEATGTNKLPITTREIQRVCDRLGMFGEKWLGEHLTTNQEQVLHTIIGLGDHVTAEEVAEETGSKRSTIVRMLLRLESGHWLGKYPAGNKIVYYIRPYPKLYLEKSILEERRAV